MTEHYYFFDDQALYQAEWSKTIGKNLLDGVLCGVYNDLFCYGDASGMQVKVSTGAMHIKGHYYFSDAAQTLPISTAPSVAGQSRYDLIVGEVDWSNKNMSVKIVQGVASAAPVMPALTQSATVWQVPLARITISNGDTNVASSSVLDLRGWALGAFTIPLIIGSGIATIETGAIPSGIVIPNRSKIVGYSLVGDVSGSIVLDLWKDTYSNYPPTVADTLCDASHKPTLSSARTIKKSVWTEATYINESGAYWPGSVFSLSAPNTELNYLLANVDSIATLKQVNLTLIFARMVSE